MPILRQLVFGLTICAISGFSLAQNNLAKPMGPKAFSENKIPLPGLSTDQVKLHFGMPTQQLPSVGKPPITRWVYDSFTVYFEKQYVIQSVATKTK